MTSMRPISRRSFLARVAGVSTFAAAGCTIHGPLEERPYDLPPEPVRERLPPSCTDGDSGRYHDRPGNGRSCRGDGGRHRPPRRGD